MVGLLTLLAGGAGAVAHAKAKHDNKEAEEWLARAERVVEAATKKRDDALRNERQKMGRLASEKRSVICGNMQRFVKYFSKIKPVNFKNIGYDSDLIAISKNQIIEINDTCTRINKIPANDIVGGVSGAMLAVSAADMLAGGSILSGSVAIGGTSVAVGTILGTVAAPVFALTGFNSAINASKNLESARAVMAKASAFEDSCYTLAQTADAVAERCDLFYSVINQINNGWFNQAVDNLIRIVESKKGVKNFWKNAFGKPIYTKEEMKSIASTMALAKMLKTLIDTNILDSSGKVTSKSLEIASNIKRQLLDFNPQEVLAQQSPAKPASTYSPAKTLAKHHAAKKPRVSIHPAIRKRSFTFSLGTVKPYVVSLLMVLAFFFAFYLPAHYVFSLAEIDPNGYKEAINSSLFYAWLTISMAIGLLCMELSISIPFADDFHDGLHSFLLWAFLGLIPLVFGSAIAMIFYSAGVNYGIFCIVVGAVVLIVATILCMAVVDDVFGNILLALFEVVTVICLIFYCDVIIQVLTPMIQIIENLFIALNIK